MTDVERIMTLKANGVGGAYASMMFIPLAVLSNPPFIIKNMSMIEEIRKKVIEANPEIAELKFGCEVRAPRGNSMSQGTVLEQVGEKFVIWFWDSEGDIAWFRKNELEIIGRPLNIQDILLVIGSNVIGDYEFVCAGDGHFLKLLGTNESGVMKYEGTGIYWNLKETFENQLEPTKKFIHNLLTDNNK